MDAVVLHFLQPSNIFFSRDGVVKVGDFGLVTALEEHYDTEAEPSAGTAQRKHTNQVGTKLYMSPEQVGTGLKVLLVH